MLFVGQLLKFQTMLRWAGTREGLFLSELLPPLHPSQGKENQLLQQSTDQNLFQGLKWLKAASWYSVVTPEKLQPHELQ